MNNLRVIPVGQQRVFPVAVLGLIPSIVQLFGGGNHGNSDAAAAELEAQRAAAAEEAARQRNMITNVVLAGVALLTVGIIIHMAR